MRSIYFGNSIKLIHFRRLLCRIKCAKEFLTKLKLPNIEQNVATLSGGEKQRVSLCRAISKNAKIILADEPSGNLDSANADNVFSFLKNIRNGRHIIIVTHDEELAKKYADRIIRLSDGEIISDEINKTEDK